MLAMAGEVEETREHELLDRLKYFIEPSPVASDTFSSLDVCLVELIGISRFSDGRARLAKQRTIPSILGLLEQVHKSCQSGPTSVLEVADFLLLLLKLARNLCAGDATNQDAFLEASGVPIVSRLATEFLSPCPPPQNLGNSATPKDSMLERVRERFGSVSTQENGHSIGHCPVSCLQMALQLLGNFAQRGEACIATIWEEFFPSLFLELVALRVREINGPLSMVLFTSCQNNGKRSWQLSQGDGAALISLLMVSWGDNHSDYALGNSSSSTEHIEWLELLLRHLCLQEPLFPLLFTNLGVPPLNREVEFLKVNTDELLTVCQLCVETSSLSSLQASLLYILCDCLSSQEVNSEASVNDLPMPVQSMCFMVDILRRAAECAAKDVNLSSVLALPSGPPHIQILGFLLSLLRISCAWDRNGEHLKLTTALLASGLVDLLLDSLEALGPPVVSPGGPSGEMILEDSPAFPRKDPYKGYRRDIVAVIGNLLHQNFFVQERVREKGGLLLVLQQCTLERENPFLREWGLWAVRNLLEGNNKNQSEIADLEVKQSVNLPELKRMGLNVEIDPKTRRPRLVNYDSSSSHL